MKIATIQLASCGPTCPHEGWTPRLGAICRHGGGERKTWEPVNAVRGPFPQWCPLPDAPEPPCR